MGAKDEVSRNGALTMTFLIIPAALLWSGGALVALGYYDIVAKNVYTERQLFMESGVFQEAVDQRVSELRAEDIYRRGKNG